MDPARNVEQVGDVLRSSASRARSGEGRVVQAREGPLPGIVRLCRRGCQVRVTVSRCAKARSREEFLSPAHILMLVEREHGGDKPGGGLPVVGANSRGASRAVAPDRRAFTPLVVPFLTSLLNIFCK